MKTAQESPGDRRRTSRRLGRRREQGVDVDLDAGRIIVSGGSIDDEAVSTAVGEAGYEVVA